MQSALNLELFKQESSFTTLDLLKINVSSWNLGGAKPMEDVDISKWLFPLGKEYVPDMFIIGFQEIVPLTAKNVVTNKNADMISYWEKTIQRCLDQSTNGDYVKISNESMVGIYITMCARRNIQKHIREVTTSSNKLGVGNTLGNKGACSIRFKYKDSGLCFACCHLESGRSEELELLRRKQMEKIIQTAFVKERGTNMAQYSWANHEIKVMFGDLNFRST